MGHSNVLSLHAPIGLLGSNGWTVGKYLDLLGLGPGGFPNQLAPTTNRNGRGRCSVSGFALAVEKVRKAGSVAARCRCRFALMAHVLCPYLHRVGGRGIRWGCSGVK